MEEYNLIRVNKKTHNRLTYIMGLEISKKKKKISYSTLIDNLISDYEKKNQKDRI